MKSIILCDSGRVNEVAILCEEHNTGIEVQAFYDPEYLIENVNSISEHKKRIENLNPKALHGPFADLCFGSFDNLIKEATMQRFNLAYDIAKQLGCTDIVLHHGYVPGTSPLSSWIKRGKLFWEEFFQDKEEGISIHLENMLEHSPEILFEIVSEVDKPELDVCLDTGHANCFSKTSVIDWIKILNSKIGYVHLHNNYGKKDEHFGFELGTIPFKEMCSTLEKYSPKAIWAMECSYRFKADSISWLKENNYL